MIPLVTVFRAVSPSSRRAWIEIDGTMGKASPTGVALLAEGVDRNCSLVNPSPPFFRSPSSRRAWIEILCCGLPS